MDGPLLVMTFLYKSNLMDGIPIDVSQYTGEIYNEIVLIEKKFHCSFRLITTHFRLPYLMSVPRALGALERSGLEI